MNDENDPSISPEHRGHGGEIRIIPSERATVTQTSLGQGVTISYRPPLDYEGTLTQSPPFPENNLCPASPGSPHWAYDHEFAPIVYSFHDGGTIIIRLCQGCSGLFWERTR